MAESDPGSNPVRTMTITEVHSLAERLLARGRTMLTPDQQGDLRLAAQALHALLRSFNRHDVVTLDYR